MDTCFFLAAAQGMGGFVAEGGDLQLVDHLFHLLAGFLRGYTKV